MEKYNVKQKKILLYGAATRGSIILEILKKKGYLVEAFIDQRAPEIKSYCNLPVYTIEHLKILLPNKTEYVVYIDLKNVFEHDSVAIELYNAGFKNLIFRPGRVLLGTGNETEIFMNDIYDELVAENFNNSIALYPVDEIRFPQIKDFSLLSEIANSEYCIVKLPTVMVYSDLEAKTSKWENISVYGLYPHISLFEDFSGQKPNGTKSYIEMCESAAQKKQVEITEKWRESVLKNRAEVYDRMQLSYDYDMNFFERNAVEAKWNDAGYFNICSGKHRCAFLIAKGTNYIILKVKKDDYQKFINDSSAQLVQKYIIENKLLRLHAPIEYPLFINYPCANYQFYYGIVKLVTSAFTKILFEKIKKDTFENISVFLSINDEGFLKRHFLRMGALVSCDSPESSLECLLDKLFRIDENRIINGETAYDFAIIDKTTLFNKNKKATYLIIIDFLKNTSNYEDCILLGTLCRGGDILALYLQNR